MQALLSRLGELSHGVLTPHLVDVVQRATDYTDGLDPLLETMLVVSTSVANDDARGPTGPGAQVRADWRPLKSKWRTVTVRIYDGADLLCQSTLDVGDATCYGNTPHLS